MLLCSVCGGVLICESWQQQVSRDPLGMKLLSKTSWVLSLWLIPPGPPVSWVSSDPPVFLWAWAFVCGASCPEPAPSGTQACGSCSLPPQLPERGHQRGSTWARRLPALFGELVGSVVHMQARKEERAGTLASRRLTSWELGSGCRGALGRKAVAGKCGEGWGGGRERRGCAGGGSGEGLLPVLH